MKKHIPLEITITILAGMTVFLTMPPLFLPVWVTYIVWGGTFLLFKEISLMECIKRTWPPLVLGATAGIITNILDTWAATKTAGISTFWVEALILGIMVLIVVYMERIPIFADGPFIFFSFASFDGILASQAGPAPHTWWEYWFVTVAMTLLGTMLAWVSFKLMLPLPSRTQEYKSTSSLSIQLDGMKPTLIVLNEQQRSLTLRDHALPGEKVIFSFGTLKQPVTSSSLPASCSSMSMKSEHQIETPSLLRSRSGVNGQESQWVEVEDVIITLLCEHLKLKRLDVNMNFPLFENVIRDSQSLHSFLAALHEHFEFAEHDFLSPQLTVSDLVTLIFNQHAGTRSHDTMKVIFQEKEA